MLTSLYQALTGLLSSMGLPLYMDDCIPQGAVLPYMTMSVDAPLTPGNAGVLCLTIWCCSESSHSDRLFYADDLLTYMPARGVRLVMDDVAVTLQQSGTASCIREKSLLGLRTDWTLRCFPV